MIQGNTIKNCPVANQDIDVAEHILGPNVAAIKGRTTKSPSNQVTQVDSTRAVVPYKLIKANKNITLCGHIMHVNKMPFVITVARQVKMLIAEWLVNMTTPMMLK